MGGGDCAQAHNLHRAEWGLRAADATHQNVKSSEAEELRISSLLRESFCEIAEITSSSDLSLMMSSPKIELCCGSLGRKRGWIGSLLHPRCSCRTSGRDDCERNPVASGSLGPAPRGICAFGGAPRGVPSLFAAVRGRRSLFFSLRGAGLSLFPSHAPGTGCGYLLRDARRATFALFHGSIATGCPDPLRCCEQRSLEAAEDRLAV